MMNLNEVVIFYFDNPENYHKEQTQSVIGKSLYKETILIQNIDDFKKKYSKLKDGDAYVLVCHVFHSEDNSGIRNMGYKKFKSEGIEEEYNIQAILVSSGDSGIVMKNIFNDEHDNKTVYSYNKIHENIRNKNIPVNIKNSEKIIVSNRNKGDKKGIFLSHSSKDADLVKKFKELVLELGLGYNPSNIKFTSDESHGIPAGADIPDNLELFLKDEMGLFIQFLTPNYTSSRVCLNEEGAAWCLINKKTDFISFIVPPHKHTLMSWIKTLDKAIEINNKSSLLNIFGHRKDFFGESFDLSRFNEKIDEFIAYFNKSIL